MVLTWRFLSVIIHVKTHKRNVVVLGRYRVDRGSFELRVDGRLCLLQETLAVHLLVVFGRLQEPSAGAVLDHLDHRFSLALGHQLHQAVLELVRVVFVLYLLVCLGRVALPLLVLIAIFNHLLVGLVLDIEVIFNTLLIVIVRHAGVRVLPCCVLSISVH